MTDRRPALRLGFPRRRRTAGRPGKGRLLAAMVLAVLSVVVYLSSRQENPVTGEVQYVKMTVDQEIALGLQAAPRLAAGHGGEHPDRRAQALVDRVGQRIVDRSAAGRSPYRFEFHLLSDEETINAFALPGGQVFITAALYRRLGTEGQLAGVLAHEVGHVVGRHGAEHMAKAELTQGLTGAAVLATYDPSDPSTQGTAAVAAMVGKMVNMKFGRDDELESDRFGVEFMAAAGYDPRSLLNVMEVLDQATEGGRPPEFFSTHPNPDRRSERIQAVIRDLYPEGVPSGLEP